MQLGLTQEQIAARRGWIGGSDAGSIVAGGEEWRKLWRIKTGRAQEEDLSSVLAVQMGSFTEPLNCFWFEKQTGRKVTSRGKLVRSKSLGANLDGMTTASGGQPAYIDFKHVGKSGDQMTLRYTAQCTHCAILTNCDWWLLSAFVGNSKWELIEQEVDPFFAAEYLAKCAEFWGYVERDEEPPEAPPLPVPAPRKLRTVSLEPLEYIHDASHGTYNGPCPECAEVIASRPNWAGAFINELEAWASTNAAHKAHMAAQEGIKKLLPEDVGTVTRGLLKVARDKAGAIRISLAKGEEK